MAKNPKGYDAIIYIARYENQLSVEDAHAIQFFKQVLGSDFMRCHGVILLFTNGNSCDTDAEKMKENFKLEMWLKKQNQSNIKSLIKECGSRIMLFNKRCKGENPNQSMMERLIQLIDGLNNEGNKYTIDKFQKAHKETEKLIGEVKRPHLKGELYIKMCRITQELNDIRLVTLGEDQVLRKLLNLKSEAELIFAELEEEDNETSALCVAMKILNTLQKSIKEKLSLFSSL
ncbi:uncharacterized protein LOC131938704 [Physella acuta]|uniref:uncharacterized protein LOC131938704 n=1 Tax=Physella acuta TaxID=109671 RepID=UPI0027DE9603|nr:uncharacterized protein LOC131938704 [Physella acuta]